MTEITAKIRWPQLALALLIGPVLVNTLLIMACAIFPPALFFGFLFGWVSLCLGYASYLILAGPLMTLAFLLGLTHPLFHAGIGFGAVWLIPAAHELGLPYIARPDMISFGQWFGPAWCAGAALIYNLLVREFPQLEEIPA